MYRFYLSLSTSDGFSETAETIACPVMAREKQESKKKKQDALTGIQLF